MKILLLLATFLPLGLFAQPQPIGQFDSHEDVGNPKLSGSAVYDPDTQTYTPFRGRQEYLD